jgi:5-oxoprolinase (ATP-hydrolysing)
MDWLLLTGKLINRFTINNASHHNTYHSAFELQEPCSTFYTPQNKPILISRLDRMTQHVRTELQKQGFEDHRIHVERMLNMRFEGTDTALMVVTNNEKDGDGEDFEAAFKRDYKTEFGFLLDTKSIIVDDIKVYMKSFLLSFFLNKST